MNNCRLQDGPSEAVLKRSLSIIGCTGCPLSNMAATFHPPLAAELCHYKLAYPSFSMAVKRCLVRLLFSEECRSVVEQNASLHIPNDRNLTNQPREQHFSLAVVSDKQIRLNHLERKSSLEFLHQRNMNIP